MNNYFSSSARRKRKSKSQLHIGAKSSLSLFHGGNELKQDFLQRETHSSRRDRHVNGFIEACIGTVRVDFQGEASIQQHKKAPQCLQSDSLKINQWTRQQEKRTEELASDNEHGCNNVVEWKQSARQRLKKRDSIRTPHFKDEIMLSENIDNVVEKEIPEITDESRAMTGIITYIMNDKIPPADLKQNDFRDLILKTERLSGNTSSKGEEVKRIKNLAPVESSVKPHPKLDPTKSVKTTEDEKKARKMKYLVSDEESQSKSKATSFPVPGRIKSGRNVLYWPIAEETDEQTPPLQESVNGETLNQEVPKVREEIEKHFNEEFPESASITSTSSGSHAKLQTLSMFHKVSNTKRYSTKQVASELAISDEKLAEDIEYILNDDISPNESNNQKTRRKVSTTKKAKRPKKSSTRDDSHSEDKELQKGVTPNLKVTKQVATAHHFSGEQNSLFPNRNLEDGIFAKDLETSSIVGPLPSPNKTTSSSRKENEQLTNDIEYILCDDIFAPGPHEVACSGSTDLGRPKTSNPKLFLTMEMDKVPLLKSLAPLTSSSRYQMNNFLDLQKPNEDDDIEITEIIENILSDDIIDINPERLNPLSSGGKHQIANRVGVCEKSSSTPNSLKSFRKKTSDAKAKNIAIPQRISGKTDSRVSKVSSDPVSQMLRDFSARTETNLKTNFLSALDITAGTKSSTFGLKARPKTRNPRRSLADDVNKSQTYSLDANLPGAFPNQKQNLHTLKPRQAKCMVIEDGLLEETTNRPNRSCSYTALGAENNYTTRKSDFARDLEDFDSNIKTVVKSFTGSPSPQDLFKGEKLQKGVTLAKQENNKCQRDASTICSPQSSSVSRKTEEIAMEEAIKEILGISAIDLRMSLQKGPVVSQKNAEKKNANNAEEIDLDEAIREILDIQRTDLDASVKNHIENDKNLTKSYSSSQPIRAEKIDSEEAIFEVFGTETKDLRGRNEKPAAKPSCMINETKNFESTTVESRDVKEPTTQALSLINDSAFNFPDAKMSFANNGSENYDSVYSLANGDALRPVTAAGSAVSPLRSTLSDKAIQKLIFSLWETRTMSDLSVKEKTTTLLTKEIQQQSVAMQRATVIPVACESSHRATDFGMLYNSEELDLIKEIERQPR